MTTNNFTASISAGTLSTIVQGGGNYPYATGSIAENPNGYYISSITDATTVVGSVITMTTNMSEYWKYQQVPYFVSASGTTSTVFSSSLYDKYGDINNTFNPQFGDKIIASDFGGVVQNLDVYTASFNTNTNQLQITVQPQVFGNWQTNPALVYRFLILRRYQDEQNVILTFNKPLGQTSYGFLIPETVNPQITNNINTLQAAVQSQLLSTQTAVTSQ